MSCPLTSLFPTSMGLSGEVTGNQGLGSCSNTVPHMVLCIKQGKEHGELGICDMAGAFLHIYCMSIKLVVKVRNATEKYPKRSSRKGTICLRHNILVTDLLTIKLFIKMGLTGR